MNRLRVILHHSAERFIRKVRQKGSEELLYKLTQVICFLSPDLETRVIL